jgi:signal transduction histidine kinase
VRERLFRRFVTTRADKGGTGLGLAIVRAVTEAHGGHVELVQPGPPRVVFRMSLPAARRSTAAQIREVVQEARQELSATTELDQ